MQHGQVCSSTNGGRGPPDVRENSSSLLVERGVRTGGLAGGWCCSAMAVAIIGV